MHLHVSMKYDRSHFTRHMITKIGSSNIRSQHWLYTRVIVHAHSPESLHYRNKRTSHQEGSDQGLSIPGTAVPTTGSRVTGHIHVQGIGFGRATLFLDMFMYMYIYAISRPHGTCIHVRSTTPPASIAKMLRV